MKIRSALVLILLGLHGCNTVEDPFLDGVSGMAGTRPTGNRELAIHQASASLAGLGEAPLSVMQTGTDGGTRQKIIYANQTTVPGENALTIASGSTSQSQWRGGPNSKEVAQVLKSEFPGIAMRIDPVIRHNAYGVYGTATGKLGKGGGCVYAWQTSDKNSAAELDEPLSVRLRYCHPNIGPEILAGLLGGLALGPGMADGATAIRTVQSPTSTYAYQQQTPDEAKGSAAASVASAATTPHEKASAAATAIPMPL
jgi:hypothetical protein